MYPSNNKRKRNKKQSEKSNELTNFTKQELKKENIIEHVQIQDREKDNYKEQCIVCWEFSSKDNEIYKMKHIPLFVSDCLCNCDVHLVCFVDWIKKTPTCPICRVDLMFDTETFNKYTLGPYYKIKLFFKQIIQWINIIINVIIKLSSLIFLLYTIIFVFSCITNYGK
jgi:hypothetical protein